MPATSNLIGKKFGMLTVLELLPKDGKKRKWLCQCECGRTSTPNTSNLNSGISTSCGCLTYKNAGEAVAKHGGRKEQPSEYKAWCDVKQKGEYESRWEDFVEFFCDVGERPSKKHQLRRKDVTRPHGKNNTYWRLANDYEALTTADLGDGFFVDFESYCRSEASARA